MPYSIEIKKDLYSSVQGVSAGYREHLERKKSETVISQKGKKWDSFQWHVKAERAVWCHQAINRYNVERHWKSMHLAESKQDLLYVIKTNALKRKYNGSEANLRVLGNQYSDLEKKRKILEKKKGKKMQKNIQFTTFLTRAGFWRIFKN